MAIFLGHSHSVHKNELSSRPEPSEVEGPAVDPSSIRCTWKRRPALCHAERSRGICSSADLSWKCFPTERSRRMTKVGGGASSRQPVAGRGNSRGSTSLPPVGMTIHVLALVRVSKKNSLPCPGRRDSFTYLFAPCPRARRKPTRKVNGSDGYPIGPILLLSVRLSSWA